MSNRSTGILSVFYDLQYYRTAIAELEEYLLSGLRDWPILISPPNSPPYPRLSPGAMLISRIRLHPSRLNSEQIVNLQELDRQKDTVCERWQSAWRGKMNLDFDMNLALWQNYLQEGQDQAAYYHTEVRQRVILDLLIAEMHSAPHPSLGRLSGLDARLGKTFVNGDFIWQNDLRPAFPNVRFWYLYGRIGGAA